VVTVELLAIVDVSKAPGRERARVELLALPQPSRLSNGTSFNDKPAAETAL